MYVQGELKKRVISDILHIVNNFCGNLIFDNNLWNFWIFFTNNRIRPFKKITQIYFLFRLDEEPSQRQNFDSNDYFNTKIVDFLNLISHIFAETTYLLCLRCDKSNIFPHFCFLLISMAQFVSFWFCSRRGSNRESIDFELNTLTTAPSNIRHRFNPNWSIKIQNIS